MTAIRVIATRGGADESVHDVHAVFSGPEGAPSDVRGTATLACFWRSSMKPFQALPVVRAGTLEALGLGPEALALACASHHGRPEHTEVVRAVLAAAGLPAEGLACGAHRPLDEEAARALDVAGTLPGRIHNNCSGKHAAMMALARREGWGETGYHEREHPMQAAVRRELGRWLDSDPERLVWGVDGCGVPTPRLGLDEMARAFARFGTSDDPAVRAVVAAMTGHPMLISGPRALSARLMAATGGRILAKEGAEGVFCVTEPGSGWGAAFKVADGAMRALGPAVLRGLAEAGRLPAAERAALAELERPEIRNTRDEVVGEVYAPEAP